MKIKEGGGMDIQKEKIAHEKHLLSQGVDFKYLPNIQYNELENVYELIEWDEEYSEALNEINSSWCTWQAAKSQAVPEWISVKNAMPKAGSQVLAYDDYGFVSVANIDGCEDPNNVYFSHWLPLPPMAQEQAND
ncbi:hypothetical protein [Acinetobacter sp. YH12233]|uniref:hypothetical protein n=1 Tax=Acinetobacter sp. YH12233 TaxID=2601161 RepID=UPI00211EED78|nr:hypothetical protein [Acinetobacter sp. YH12233]